MARLLDEFIVGQTERFGAYPVTREDVIEFAARYDPQPFHLNDSAAASNPIFGRLAASGWHIAAIGMRMVVDHGESVGGVGLGSPGLEELSWLRPVYPGDTLHAETEILGIRRSQTRPDIGFVKSRLTLFNQHDEPVLRQVGTVIYPTGDA